MTPPTANIPMAGIVQSGPIDTWTPPSQDQIQTNLRDLTIVITGGASGLGAAFARHWSAHGANIIIGDVNTDRGLSVVAELRRISSGNNNNDNNDNDNKDDKHHFIPLDVTSWSSQLDFFEEAVRLSPHGGIDCVVANAGISLAHESTAFENPVDYHRRLVGRAAGGGGGKAIPAPEFKVLDVNVAGVLYTAHLAGAYLAANPSSVKCSLDPPPPPSPPTTSSSSGSSSKRDRHLLLIGSLAGLSPVPTQSLYSISKHAVVGLFRNLRTTWPVTHGVRVNMLCPYFAQTPILGVAGRAVMAGGAMATVDTVVEAATFFVAARGVIGRALAVGPRVSTGDAEIAGLVSSSRRDRGDDTPPETQGRGRRGPDEGEVEGEGEAHGIWEIYAHDSEQSDIFSRRVLATTNLAAGRKGILDLLRDMTRAVLGGILGKVVWPTGSP